MAQTVLQQDTADLMSKITALFQHFNTNKDIQTAERARDLALKLQKQEYSIAFCGHFSAGKSSMINKLVGEDLLPSSPIPTSANLVKIKAGDDYAKVIFKEGMPKLYTAPYDYNQVKSYCKDGDQIQAIEISYSNTSLPTGVNIMDTPGIDSTDDAHRIATESALHLADLIFYVMDYNHVQSELNFLFTKELTIAGKQVYLIINQIDKHREEELSFAQFKESVKNSFATWGVIPARIFYTSLKQELHQENEFHTLQQFIQEKMEKRQELLPVSIFHSLKKLNSEHAIYLEEEKLEEIEKYEEILLELSDDERESVFDHMAMLEKALAALKSSVEKIENNVDNRVDDILKNAYLMPFQTRDLAKAYIESRQKNFKVGLFFSRQKTEEERNKRLQLLYKDLSEKVKSQLEWHLRELFFQVLKEQDVQDSNVLASVQSYELLIGDNLLIESVKEGALLSGDYVLNYTNDVAMAIKKLAKNSIFELKELCIAAMKVKNEVKESRIETEIQQVKEYVKAANGLNKIKEKLQYNSEQTEKILSGEFQKEQYSDLLTQMLAEQIEEVEIINDCSNLSLNEHHKGLIEAEPEQPNSEQPEILTKHSTDVLVEKLQFTANAVRNVPGFHKMAAELIQKADRLLNKQFTVALFGAFSAGKSSFANALIGEKVLPVSPNPTTAAINKIMPINDENQHGTVLVKVKDADVLFADVNHSLKAFSMTAANFKEAIEKIKQVIDGKTDFEANEKTHIAFLHAFLRGFDSFQKILGTIVRTDLAELKDYVAIEEKSCFVDMIEVYYDCELTQKGITLVDTPGADSINARHTGVAFDYIKNSDAILFVTYYNHAFSKADREFLIQLGRVKDAFQLDKMFFIVNAIDLANNEEEKQSVMEYVSEQLIQYGIRRPNLYGVSSLTALAEKLEQKREEHSNIQLFEKSFYSFISHDLMEISISAAQLEWQRVLEQLRKFIHSSQEDKELKEKKRTLLEKEQKSVRELIDGQTAEIFSQKLIQEIDELIFYLHQRVFFRHHDFVKEAFNPTLLKEDGRNLKKAIQTALEDFLHSFGFDFAQELRATTLRIETFIGKSLNEASEMIKKLSADINEELSFSPFEMKNLPGLDFETAFMNEDRFQFKKALAYFKNPKSFFEKNERRFLSDELEQIMQQPAKAYLQSENKRLKDHYQHLFAEEYARMLHTLIEQADEYYGGIFAVLSEDYPIEQLQVMEKKLSNYE